MDDRTRDALLAADGDDAAFTRLMRSSEPDVRRFCMWHGADGSDIDDVVQETFIRAYKGLNTYRGDAPALAWLLTIARRVRLDEIRRLEREDRLVRMWRHEYPGFLAYDHSLTEMADSVRALPLEFREAFVLVKVFGYSYEEAASIVGCPRGTVQSRVARARVMLISHMQSSTDYRVS